MCFVAAGAITRQRPSRHEPRMNDTDMYIQLSLDKSTGLYLAFLFFSQDLEIFQVNTSWI